MKSSLSQTTLYSAVSSFFLSFVFLISNNLCQLVQRSFYLVVFHIRVISKSPTCLVIIHIYILQASPQWNCLSAHLIVRSFTVTLHQHLLCFISLLCLLHKTIHGYGLISLHFLFYNIFSVSEKKYRHYYFLILRTRKVLKPTPFHTGYSSCRHLIDHFVCPSRFFFMR